MQRTKKILFSCGIVFKLWYNIGGKFSQVQSDLLFELPSLDDNNNLKTIKVLAYSPGINYIEFNTQATQKSSIDKIIIDVKFGIAPEYT